MPANALIKVVIVEDHDGTRKRLASTLDGTGNLRCVAAYRTGEEAVARILLDQPDVAVVDIHLPGMNGIECVAKLKAALPKLQVLMLTAYDEDDLIFNSLRAGASGYLLKKAAFEELVSAVTNVLAGDSPMSMPIARKVVEHFQKIRKPDSDMQQLTPREREILELLAQGNLYKEIAARLGISNNTVSMHVKNIYGKLHVQTRTEATVRFLAQR